MCENVERKVAVLVPEGTLKAFASSGAGLGSPKGAHVLAATVLAATCRVGSTGRSPPSHPEGTAQHFLGHLGLPARILYENLSLTVAVGECQKDLSGPDLQRNLQLAAPLEGQTKQRQGSDTKALYLPRTSAESPTNTR